MKIPATSFAPYMPVARPMNPPTTDPTMPSRMVTIMPPRPAPA